MRMLRAFYTIFLTTLLVGMPLTGVAPVFADNGQIVGSGLNEEPDGSLDDGFKISPGATITVQTYASNSHQIAGTPSCYTVEASGFDAPLFIPTGSYEEWSAFNNVMVGHGITVTPTACI